MANNKDFLTTAPQKQQVTIANSNTVSNEKHMPGDSEDEYQNQKEANLLLSGDEIHQQNENL